MNIHYPVESHSWLGSCLEVLLPGSCHVCCRPLKRGILCYRCQPALPSVEWLKANSCSLCFSQLSLYRGESICNSCRIHPLTMNSIRYLWDYSLLARDFIRAMKYKPSEQLTSIAGGLLSLSLPLLFQKTDWDIIVPMPSSATGFSRRLFNPSVGIAQTIRKRHGIPIRNILIRNLQRRPQALLSHTERLRGLGRLFSLSNPHVVNKKSVLLVEDVITTGATIAAASYTLRAHGAHRVDIIALARTSVWNRFRSEITSKLPRHTGNGNSAHGP